ncbi:MAG TPA: tetratricopeptide repeat protein [Candidatus Kapabacteria bacterium]|nr:tetratricopeptide repeat protein [Candidatus Kapabacteria bacterium]
MIGHSMPCRTDGPAASVPQPRRLLLPCMLVLLLAAPALRAQSVEEFLRKGDAAAHARDFKAALGYFGKALAIAPHNTTALLWRSGVLLYTGDTAAALEDLNRTIELDQRSPAARVTRASVFIEQKLYAAAIEDLHKVTAIDPKDTTALLLLVKTHLAAGEQFEAMADMRRYLEAVPDGARANELRWNLDQLGYAPQKRNQMTLRNRDTSFTISIPSEWNHGIRDNGNVCEMYVGSREVVMDSVVRCTGATITVQYVRDLRKVNPAFRPGFDSLLPQLVKIVNRADSRAIAVRELERKGLTAGRYNGYVVHKEVEVGGELGTLYVCQVLLAAHNSGCIVTFEVPAPLAEFYRDALNRTVASIGLK